MMKDSNIVDFIRDILKSMPSDWKSLTTHRLDIYREELAKFEFLEELEKLYSTYEGNSVGLQNKLEKLPTAFDYIRLGHPLSCILEWFLAKVNSLKSDSVVSFSSTTMPCLAILRRNLLDNKKTRFFGDDELGKILDIDTLKTVYGYDLELLKTKDQNKGFEGVTVSLISLKTFLENKDSFDTDFTIAIHKEFGSLIFANNQKSQSYISEILHVRRRESIAMTPHDCAQVLEEISNSSSNIELSPEENFSSDARAKLLNLINKLTRTSTKPIVGSCGLSIQYAIMMGLIHHAQDKYKGREIKLIVPPNCYGGTNDQARRVAACLENVEVLDLAVDSGQNMVQSTERVLELAAKADAVPLIIAEIPTNPRVEVPDLNLLSKSLAKIRKTKKGEHAISPVFILDQTFCPNVEFLGDEGILSNVKTISYVSGSKFPSGGLCTAGYCVANNMAAEYISYISKHLDLCDNTATSFQMKTLFTQMPSMFERIESAYKNTRNFTDHIQAVLPQAKINFVSKELADAGFTPSVFSLDLPTRGENSEEREAYKRDLNLKLIHMMIDQIPSESKYCVSYGQLKGCYWTIPATSTQGTTKEGDKDYIVRVAVSPMLDLQKHKNVFSAFCEAYIKD